MNWSGSLKLMDNDKRVQITGGRLYAVLPHPDGPLEKSANHCRAV